MYGFIAVNTSNCETLRIAVDDIVYYDKLISEDRLTDPSSTIKIVRGDYDLQIDVRETVEQLDSLIEAAENEKAAKLASALSSVISRRP